MPLGRRLLVTAAVILPPSYYVAHTANRLESTYPPLPPERTTTALTRIPAYPSTQQLHNVDVYGARVPLQALRHISQAREKESIEETWGHAFFSGPSIALEGRLLGLGRMPELGEDGFQEGQILLNGGFKVIRAPSSGHPLLLKWDMPPGPRKFFEMIGRWGYPWRLMSGGRHELSVGPVDEKGMVEVRFASAHDYETVKEEGGAQKRIPKWVDRAHRLFARWLLDEFVRKAKAQAQNERWKARQAWPSEGPNP
ncbi:MAG: hypothetical protein M1834_000101 [Cirrosporium novae-zelandiae]|nr:MAG: hypothetical protein M1834_000101 [Cirrosporium novae-zelandiae]